MFADVCDEALSPAQARLAVVSRELRNARYWLGVYREQGDGSALAAVVISEQRNKVARLEAELDAARVDEEREGTE